MLIFNDLGRLSPQHRIQFSVSLSRDGFAGGDICDVRALLCLLLTLRLGESGLILLGLHFVIFDRKGMN